ncbi:MULTISPECIES: S8 family peptidase [unclassified Streptomyces]|uniref:S8 family peptidase n=1 Tax=unclassified Streptomyces TaxID=2593676 RepID=UPI003812F7BF
MPRRRHDVARPVLTLSVAVVLAAASVTGSPGHATAAPTGSGVVPTGGTARSGPGSVITLITGDRVRVDAEGAVTGLQRAAGRERIPVQTRVQHGRTHVIPYDARELIASGTLDQRLFDVTELSRAQSLMSHRDGLKVIVGYTGGPTAVAARTDVRTLPGTQLRRTLRTLNADAVTAPAEDPAALWKTLTAPKGDSARTAASGIARIWLDGVNRASLDTSVGQVGTPRAWAAGHDGTGVKIAVLDTGIEAAHPDLKGQVIGEANFSASPDTKDRNGHGTHVASIAAGTGAGSAGKHKGVAPGAKVLSGKVLDDDGRGDDSSIVAGMEWAVAQGADIVNLSLGGWDTPGTDPKEAQVEKASAEKGVLFAIAAGNDGRSARTVGSPGSAPSALTVGGVDDNDAMYEMSSGGPLPDGSVKPDITAPGVGITAASSPGSTIERMFGQNPPGYVTISGTSMATPHVAGAAALLKQKNPGWTYKELKSTLTASAQEGPYSPFEQGSGRLAVDRAVEQTVTADANTVDFGRQAWPHTDNTPVTRTVAYRNQGARDTVLQLSAKGVGPDGTPAPAGFFTLGEDRITVPAGGTASVTVTADTRLAGGNSGPGGSGSGSYAAALTAAGDGHTVRTTASVELETESYDVTVRHIARDGSPGDDFTTELLANHSTTEFRWTDRAAGIGVIRAPKGSYLLQSSAAVDPLDSGKGFDLLSQPRLTVDKDTTVTVDARTAEPVSITVPDPAAKSTYALTSYTLDDPGGNWLANSYSLESFTGLRTAHIGPEITDGSLSQTWSTQWKKPSGEEYRTVSGGKANRFATGYTKHFAAGEFATVRVGLGGSVKGKRGDLSLTGTTGVSEVGPPDSAPEPLPASRTLLLSTAEKATWNMHYRQYGSLVDQGKPLPDGLYLLGGAKTYRAGKEYRETFNTGVVQPSLRPGSGVFREGDLLWGRLGLFDDAQGHEGLTNIASSRTTLHRGTTKIGEYGGGLWGSQGFEVAPEAAEYTLASTSTRTPDVSRISSRTDVSWTFRTERPTVGTRTELPVSLPRFGAVGALDGTVRAGATTTLPVTVQGPAAGRNLGSLVVSVSYDNGLIWRKVPVTKGRITLPNPAKDKSVALRAEVTDVKGNRGTVTVYDAYFGR